MVGTGSLVLQSSCLTASGLLLFDYDSFNGGTVDVSHLFQTEPPDIISFEIGALARQRSAAAGSILLLSVPKQAL